MEKRRLFEDRNHAEVYAKYRVCPPEQLIDRVVDYVKEKYDGKLDLAVDVGCGSGQNTFLVARHFERVIGSDVSQSQIEFAKRNALKEQFDKVTFEAKPAETISAADGSVQLITAAEAFHWFDIPKFFGEADRVLCPGGAIALMGYVLHEIYWERNPLKSCAITAAHEQMWMGEPLYDLWAWQNKNILFTKYNITLPFSDVVREVDLVAEDRKLTLGDLGGEIKTWSAFQTFCTINGEKAGQRVIDAYKDKILDVISDDLNEEERDNPDGIEFRVKTPFFLLMGRKPLLPA